MTNEQEQLHEAQWNPLRLGQSYSGGPSQGAGDSKTASSSWYNRFISNEGSRKTKLVRYNEMDMQSVEIARALDTMAEDISCSNKPRESTFVLEYPTDTKLRKGLIKLTHQMKDMWEERTKLNTDFYYYVREVLKYGSIFFYKKPDGSLQKIRHEQLIGYVVSEKDETIVTHYVIDPRMPHLDVTENFNVSKSFTLKAGDEKNQRFDYVPVDDLLVLKNGVGPFGESVLERIYGVWRMMKLLEDAVVIYRVVRAPERRVFYIDVGRLPPHKHEGVMRRYQQKQRQKQIMRNGEMTTDFDPHSTTEDFYLPVTSQGRSSRIETLQGGGQLGELGDLTYMARKLAKGLRVPPSMMETHNDQNDRDTYSDMRVGQVYQVEMRYMGYISRVQTKLSQPLYNHYHQFSKERGVIIPKEGDFYLAEAHSFSLYRTLEYQQTILNVANSLTQMNHISKKYAMREFMHMDEDEVIENEVLVLRQKGLTEDQIKNMPEEAVANIVYGDGRLGDEFGIPKDDGMGF